uniref:Uncharacterized protein n=1 Tax=Steinernema glaseri TaxID=37863 RepID=A0A1I7YAA5_9BILA
MVLLRIYRDNYDTESERNDRVQRRASDDHSQPELVPLSVDTVGLSRPIVVILCNGGVRRIHFLERCPWLMVITLALVQRRRAPVYEQTKSVSLRG